MQSANSPLDLPLRRRPTPSQVALGIFIVWQLFFLVASNFLHFRAHTKPLDNPQPSIAVRAADAVEKFALPALPQPSIAVRAADAVEKFALPALDRWGQFTGQTQTWWMFAMSLPDSTFPLVKLRWRDRVEILRSVWEPGDPSAYFHPLGGGDRLFHYEMNLMLYNPWKDGKLKPEDARKAARPVYAYLRWRLAQFQQEHPDLPRPDAVILFCRAYPTPPRRQPLGPRPGPTDRPLFRWRPGSEEAAGFLPIEPYDPAARRFVPLKDDS